MTIEMKIKYPFSVDTWTEASKRKPHHFLTHAHKDHTAGIECHGSHPIYCSPITRRIMLRRHPKVGALPLSLYLMVLRSLLRVRRALYNLNSILFLSLSHFLAILVCISVARYEVYPRSYNLYLSPELSTKKVGAI